MKVKARFGWPLAVSLVTLTLVLSVTFGSALGTFLAEYHSPIVPSVPACPCAPCPCKPCPCKPCPCKPCPCDSPVDVSQDVIAPYVQIGRPDTAVGSGPLGSATAIQWKGGDWLLGCAHVDEVCNVDGYVLAYKFFPGSRDTSGQYWLAKLTYLSTEHDIAVYRPLTSVGLTFAHFDASVTPARGEPAWYCGSPKGLHASLERSIVNDPRAWRWDKEYLSVNGNGWYGNSGCGVYVERHGKASLVGVLVRLAWVDARAPVLCEPIASIVDGLDKASAVKGNRP